MTIVRFRRQSASCRNPDSAQWLASGFFCSGFALVVALAILHTPPACAQDKGEDDWIDFRPKSFIAPSDPGARDDPRHLTIDEVQALMRPADDVQEWDARLASPIVVLSPYQNQDTGSEAPWRDPLDPDPLLTELEFSDADFVDRVKDGYENFNRGLAEGLFGKKAGKYFEIDIDKSPEIKFEIRFD